MATKKRHRLFELLVVGGGLWVATGCGGELTRQDPQQQPSTGVRRVLPDGGVPDGGEGGDEPSVGYGSGFW